MTTRTSFPIRIIVGLGVGLAGWAGAIVGRADESGRGPLAASYFPNWGPVETSWWGLMQRARPPFAGHLRPKVSAWGYEDESEPAVMARKIAAALARCLEKTKAAWFPGLHLNAGPWGLPQDSRDEVLRRLWF